MGIEEEIRGGEEASDTIDHQKRRGERMRRNGCEEKLGRRRGTGKWRKKERLDAICCEDERVKGEGKSERR